MSNEKLADIFPGRREHSVVGFFSSTCPTEALGRCELDHSNSLSFWKIQPKPVIKIIFKPHFQQDEKAEHGTKPPRLKRCSKGNEKQSGFPTTANKREFRREEINEIIKRLIILLKNE